jgi:hypothetical protein
MLAIFIHPFMLSLVYPALIIAGIVVLLLPSQGEVTYEYKGYKASPVDISDDTQIIPVVKNYGGNYDTYETRPVGAIWGEEMERQMMARILAFEILYELGQKARKNIPTSSLCVA